MSMLCPVNVFILYMTKKVKEKIYWEMLKFAVLVRVKKKFQSIFLQNDFVIFSGLCV